VRRFGLVLGIFFISAVSWPVAAAQTDGHAEISRPAEGDSVSGVVTILGSASSPSFDHFELSFGYDPNPTDTWFPVGDSVTTQVSFGRLGLWDTTKITDGTYALRLTVTLDDGSVLEDIVEGIEVRGAGSERTAPESGTPAPSEVPAIGGSITGLATPTMETAVTSQPPARERGSNGRGIDVAGVVLAGAGTGILGLLGLAAYVRIRQNLRRRWDSTRSRRVYTGSKADDRQEGGRP
jgi:hypothetical protein